MSSSGQPPNEPDKDDDSLGAVPSPILPAHDMSEAEVAIELARRGIDPLSLHESERLSKLTSVLQMDKDRSEYTKEEAEEVARTCSYGTLTYLLQKHEVRYRKDDLTTDSAKRERLKYHLLNRDLPRDSFSDLLSKVQEELAVFKHVSKRLEDIGKELDSFVQREVHQDQRLKDSLLQDLPDYQLIMNRSLKQLEKGECPIIVTGEVSTGKSAFLNLLLQGQDLRLPESEHESTSCVCEIKYGDHAQVFAYHRSPPSEGDNAIVFQKTDIETLDNIINYDRFQEGRLPYKKVVIFVPLEMLKCGLVLVDTPGVGSDRDEMEKFVEEYLQHAAGFVYIVNKSMNVYKLCRLFAVEEENASKFLQSETDCSDSDPSRQVRKTLFIANKWDLIQDEETMRQTLIEKLQKHWLDPGSLPKKLQLLPLAATRDTAHLRARYLSERVEVLVGSLSNVISRNMKLQLRRHCSFFQLVCSRIEYHTQRYLHAVELKKNGNHTVHDEADTKLEDAVSTRKTQLAQLKDYVKKLDISNIISEFRQYLQSPGVRDSIIEWKQSESPFLCGSYSDMEAIAKPKVEARLLRVIETWDDEKHLLADKRQEIAKEIQTLYDTLELDISAISNTLTPVCHREFEVLDVTFCLLPKPSLVRHLMLKTGSVTMGKRRTKSNSSESPTKTMKDFATAMLDNLLEEGQVNKLLKDALGLNQIHTKVKDQMKRAITIKRKEVKELKEVKPSFTEVYEPPRKKCLDIYQKLQLWEVEHLFEEENIGYDKVTTSSNVEPFAKGRTAAYHRGTFTNRHKSVIVKKYTTASDMRAILRDFKWLRKQESPFFAKVLGVILQKEATDLDVHMVLETCSCTLEDWLHTPATSIEVRTAFGLSEQLCSALEVLHDSGYVHGELEPSTVMLVQDPTHCPSSQRVTVKLYHSGFKKGTIRPLQTAFEGVTPFSAPEIATNGKEPGHSREVFWTPSYDPSWDVFSLGKILIQLWQGVKYKYNATKASKPDEQLDPLSAVASQLYDAPEDVELQQRVDPDRPPISYQRLVWRCSSTVAIVRPDVHEVRIQLASIRKELLDQ